MWLFCGTIARYKESQTGLCIEATGKLGTRFRYPRSQDGVYSVLRWESFSLSFDISDKRNKTGRVLLKRSHHTNFQNVLCPHFVNGFLE